MSDIRKLFMFLLEKMPKESADTTEEILGSSVLLQRAVKAELAKRLKSPWTPAYCKNRGICQRGEQKTWQREGCADRNTFTASHIMAPSGVGDIQKKIPKDLQSYYKRDLKFVQEQPLHHHEVASSVIETNSASWTAHQERDNEWNHIGLASRLSPEEYYARKRQRVDKKIKDHLRQSIQQYELANDVGVTQDLMSVIKAIGVKAGPGGKTKGSRFVHSEKLQFALDEEKTASQMGIGEGPRVDTEQELLQKQEQELETFKTELKDITSKFESMEMDVKKFTAGIKQMEEQTASLKRSNEEMETTYRVKKRTLDLLPDADNNIAKLQAVVDSSAQRITKLADQWEKHREPLIQQYRELKQLNENKMGETQQRLEEIKDLRRRMKELADQTRDKDELTKQLASEYERMTKDLNRSAYTRRIMEIVGNIRKQKGEIDKILIDTKSLQKEINQLSGKLDRTFTVTDELIFKDAKKEEAVRKAYKYLAALHENCDILIKTVTDTGAITREIRELEDQIESESSKKIEENLQRITGDLTQMKKENSTMLSKIKKHEREK